MLLQRIIKIKDNDDIPDFIIKFIKKTDENFDISKNDNSALLGFLTPEDSEWDMQNIIKAKDHFINFSTNNIIDNYNQICKNKTNEEYNNYDISMIYQYLLKKFYFDNSIKIKKEIIPLKDIKKENLIFLLNFENSNFSYFKHFLSYILLNTDINILNISKSLHFDFKYKKSDRSLNKELPFLNTILTDKECINYLAKYENIDISISSFPYDEFKHFYKNKNNYIPKDSILNNIYSLNPNYIYLDCYYKDNFKDYYTIDNINNLKNNDNVNININLDYYNILSKQKNIYISFLPNFENKDIYQKHDNENLLTYFYNENIKEVKYLFSYGEYNKYIYLSLREILDFFLSNKDYVDFLNKEKLLTEYSINKLHNFIINLEDQNIKDLYKKLLEIKEKDKNYLEDIYLVYKTKNNIEKEEIISYIKNLFILGMKLRGWEKNDYILKKDKVKNDYEKILINIIDVCRDINVIYNLNDYIKGLKTINYINSRFIICDINIYDKFLDIINNNKEDLSCLKEGSNYLIYTSYYYYKLFEKIEIINIHCFEEI